MNEKKPTTCVTGAAGFIGFHVAKRLLEDGLPVFGVDNLNDYYDVGLKQARIAELQARKGFTFEKIEIADGSAVMRCIEAIRPTRVVHLAAQAGVRYSITHPQAYIDSNIQGFLSILEACRHLEIEHLVYASSSSVYGANTLSPFSIHHNVDHPVSLYAATKKANELMAHSYSHLYGLPTTGLRFFSVYGPWGRPDMALFLFTKAIIEGRPIDIYNFGQMKRAFTYIDDIVEGVVRTLWKTAEPEPNWSGDAPDPGTSNAPYRLYNIGNCKPVELLRYIELIESAVGKKAIKNLLPMQQGDVPESCADIRDLEGAVGYQPKVTVEEGIPKFVAWYRSYYGV